MLVVQVYEVILVIQMEVVNYAWVVLVPQDKTSKEFMFVHNSRKKVTL